MTDRIETVDGDAGWTLAEPLLDAVWPPDVVATLPWKDVVWANPQRRVFTFDRAGNSSAMSAFTGAMRHGTAAP